MRTALFILLSFIFINASATNGTLTIKATTKPSSNPHEGVDNIIAIWVENASGNFVKTLHATSKSMEYRQNLLNWKLATTLAASPYNVVDAVTSATYHTHVERTGIWNGTNTSGAVVADGTYKVRFEIADNDFTSYSAANVPAYTGTFTFTKGPEPVTLSPANVGLLTGISITWAPDITSTPSVAEASMYKVYPNPVNSTLYVPGFGVNGISIYSITGELVMVSNQNEINVSSLHKGNYIIRINTVQGNYVQKFTKQ